MTGEFWPATAEEFFAVAENPADSHNAWLRQVLTYWDGCGDGAARAVSAELFVDCNAEGFSCWQVFAHSGRYPGKNPGFLMKTAELVNRFSAASQRYEAVLKNVEARRKSMPHGKRRTASILTAEA